MSFFSDDPESYGDPYGDVPSADCPDCCIEMQYLPGHNGDAGEPPEEPSFWCHCCDGEFPVEENNR